MVRIGGGVFPDIKEPDYLGERGYTIDDKAGKVELLCIRLYWVIGFGIYLCAITVVAW